jgi:hypothetical protein
MIWRVDGLSVISILYHSSRFHHSLLVSRLILNQVSGSPEEIPSALDSKRFQVA